MTDYYTQSVVDPQLPISEVSEPALELLKEIFDHEVDEKNNLIYFFARSNFNSEINEEFSENLKVLGIDNYEVEEFLPHYSHIRVDTKLLILIFEKIIKNAPSLEQIDLIMSYNCSRVMTDGFGGCKISVRDGTYFAIDTSDMIPHNQFISIEDLQT